MSVYPLGANHRLPQQRTAEQKTLVESFCIDHYVQEMMLSIGWAIDDPILVQVVVFPFLSQGASKNYQMSSEENV